MYQDRLRKLDEEIESASVASSKLLFAIIANIAIFIFLLATHVHAAGWSIPIIIIIAASQRNARRLKDGARARRLKTFYLRGMDRMQHAWMGKGHSGEEYRESAHLYDLDLNILGPGSLFELLSTSRTEIGRRRLASYLLHSASAPEARARQQAVQELRDQTKLRDDVVLIGKYEFSGCDEDAFVEWLDAPATAFPPGLSWLILISPIALIGLVIVGLLNIMSWPDIMPWAVSLIVFQAAVGYLVQSRVQPILIHARALAAEFGILGQGLHLLAAQKFTSPKLVTLATAAAGASRPLKSIELYMNWVRERDKEWLYWVSIYTMMGTQLAIAIERWRVQHRQHLEAWMDTWGEFEALQSLACYASEHPSDAFPTFAESSVFEAHALGHPLLAEAHCIRNDVDFTASGTPFWIISGSNMAGKSTLLRSIGANTVLALAGAPVRAASLHLAAFRVCASIAPADSLLEGKSRFMAEVERIRDTIAAATAAPALFLIDEIFSGTNSHDRRIAAEAVVRALLKHGAVGALSTHDLALTEIAALPGFEGRNVHMCSRDDADALDFDYLIKPGVNRQSNALAIARLAGVDV
ncbi:MAG: hypothetical protein ABI811_15000 [Acidobacteriota bacterium]